jgi:AbrB family looped-hinge helix DNA binding protein
MAGDNAQFMGTMTTRGRVTIPKSLRDALGWKPADRIEWIYENNSAIMRKVEPLEGTSMDVGGAENERARTPAEAPSSDLAAD